MKMATFGVVLFVDISFLCSRQFLDTRFVTDDRFYLLSNQSSRIHASSPPG